MKTLGSRLPPDAEIVQRLGNRDEELFRQIVREWTPGMERLARQFVSTREAASDAVQETWIAFLNGLDCFEGRSALRTWTWTILVNTARRSAMREGRSIPFSSAFVEDGDTPTVDPSRFRGPNDPYPDDWRSYPQPWSLGSPEAELLKAEIRSEIGNAIDSLPQRQRIVIILRDVQGCLSEEVSEILGITAANQRVLLHRARASARNRLEHYFETTGRQPASRVNVGS